MQDDDTKLVTVANYYLYTEAYLAKSRLEAEGIPAVVADENIVTINWFYANAVSVKLQVFKKDAARALEILKHCESQESEQSEPAEPAQSQEAETPQPSGIPCPKCNSSETARLKYSRRWFFLSILLLGFPIPFLKRKWKCLDCGHEWDAPK